MCPTYQSLNAQDCRCQQRRGDRQQVHRADGNGQSCCEERTNDRACAASRSNKSEEPFRLDIAEEIRHEAPEDGHDEEVEDADPYEERPGDSGVSHICLEQREEDQYARDKKRIDEGKEALSRKSGCRGAEDRYDGKHYDKRSGEYPLQILHASRDSHFVAEWPEDVIAAQEAEKIKERPEDGSDLMRLSPNEATEHRRDRAAGRTVPSWSKTAMLGHVSVPCFEKLW